MFQSFKDKPLRVHPGCGGALNKVFHPRGVVFKGSGYYVTDSRPNGKKASQTGKSGDGSKTAGSNGSSGSGEPDKTAKPSSKSAAAD